MKTLIKGGWIVDPSQGIDEPMDLLIEGDRIERMAKNIEAGQAKVIDAAGKVVAPGLIDIHVHFREPGFEEKETIETGAKAAVAGGFTTVVCMPNTKPVIDNVETVAYIQEKAAAAACRVAMMGSITKNLEGIEKSPYQALKAAGIVGITDDGKTVMDARVLYEAMKEAKIVGLVVSEHCEDMNLVYDRSIHRGEISQKLNLNGIPALAEDIIIQRDILLAEETGASLHIQHLSTGKGVELVREAKKKGIAVTCEATPHHFLLSHQAVLAQGTQAKMSPPLRNPQDVEAVVEGLLDGTIDVIVTDHAPHTEADKDQNLINAANGIVGLETSLGISLTVLVHERKMTLTQLIECMSCRPARLLQLAGGTLKKGALADVTILDIHEPWVVKKEDMYSKGKNMPFEGLSLKGRAVCTLVNGTVVYLRNPSMLL